ncbi:MAG: serine/threonine protein kinase, partial [Myxococcales bacterium]|nr:serine/threonine protein kinase [Myxococcales bacterium]
MSRPIELGPFVLLDPIGSGAMGTVYHAIHPDSGARVAVKVLRPEAAADELALDNLEGEVRAVALLDHPHIVRIYDVGKITAEEAERAPHALVAGTPWFAMEVAEHGSLQRRLRSLDGNDLFELLEHLLSALAHAHARGILHLDLKPANVMFGGRTQGALLTDFGMGVVGDPDPTGDFVRGTPHFMAPELVRGRWEELGPWTDLYALGCLAYSLAAGHRPFRGKRWVRLYNAHLHEEPPPLQPLFPMPDGFEDWLR